MRKYRCPHCGEESFEKFSDKLFMSSSQYSTKKRSFTKCKNCNKNCGLYLNDSKNTYQAKSIFEYLLIFVDILVWIIILSTATISFLYHIPMLNIISIVVIILDGLSLQLVKTYLFKNMIRLDDKYEEIPFVKDADIEIYDYNKTSYLKNGSTLAVKFGTPYSEFNTKLFPAFFDDLKLSTDKKTIQGNLSFINRNSVSNLLCFEGAQFIIIDNNIPIAKGIIIKKYY